MSSTSSQRPGAAEVSRTLGITWILVVTGCALVEVLLLFGLPIGPLTLLLMFAAGGAVFRDGARDAAPAVAVATVYGVGRLLVGGYEPFDSYVILFSTFTAGFVPVVALLVRRLSVAWRQRAVKHAVTRAVDRAVATTREEGLASITAMQIDERTALNALDALVWETESDLMTVRFINNHSENLLGYPGGDDERSTFRWDEIVHSDDAKKLRTTLEAVMEDGQPRRLEYRIRARDGYALWVGDRVCRLDAVQGRPTRLRGMGVDISGRKTTEEELNREKERYRSLFEGVPVGLYRMNPQGEFLVANSALVNMMGYTNHQALYATNANDIYSDSMDRWRWQNAMVHVHGLRSFELPCRRADGSTLWVRNTARAVRTASGEIAYYEGVVEDISDGKRALVAEEAAEAKFRGLVEQSLVGIFMVQDGALVYANPKLSEIFGYSHAELLGLPNVLTLVAEEHQTRVESYLSDRLAMEDESPVGFRGVRKDGSLVDVEVHCTKVSFNDRPAILVTLLDVTSRKETEERLFQAAFHDPLTGLPNRILFMERLEHAFLRQKRGREFAVLFVDLNRFKSLNDSLGHAAGDEMLNLVGHRLNLCIRPGDTVARFGGDEFAMLVEDIAHVSDATQIAERVREAISTPALINGQDVQTGGSIGIALSSAGYRTPEEILRDADLAMYRAKGAGSSHFEIFDEAMHGEALERIEMENDLQRATERGDFHLQFLPIVCLKTGEMAGVEALVRWTHAERGDIAPSTFIPLAEDIGVITPLGRQVLRMACTQAAQWQARFPREQPLSVSVNLSPKQIQGSAIVEDVRQVLEETGLAPGSLKLEITEGLILDDQRAAAHMLNRLKALGVRIFLDDFGTGYSSLGYLHTLPIDTLKIDRTFINRLESPDAGSHLVRTIVTVAHNLGMEVVAEGAETVNHVKMLQDLGCEFAQGFHFSPPCSAEEIEAILESGEFEVPGVPRNHLRVMGRARS